jgi:hypothetical protein
MARKRGGLAGIWDRKKQFIKPIATIGAGLINPALGAAVGGAIGGFDRPGKGGIGFDVGKGALGAAQGYAMGKGAQGLKGMFTSSAAPAISGSMPAVGITPGGAGALTQSMAASAAPSAASAAAAPAATTAVQQAGGRMAGTNFLKDLFTAQGIGGLASGTMGAISEERKLGLERDKMRQSQQQFERGASLNESRFAEEKRQAELNEERRRRMAQLMAMFAPGVLQRSGIGQPPMAEG